ncbi:MAG TPA: aminotransferase class I/II-fold pyridoxal phosphate-dependent enzyme [Propionibacteriaceae bacterium]|nr:aminotransferase class I/II-fold pyridoxal phosphate-dependent enzyme [Propionibacteriaceae bacterium]
MAILDLDLDVLRQRTSMKWTRFEPDVLPLWVAEMDVLSPPGVTRAMQHVLEIGDFGYPGYESLPRAFAAFAETTWGLALDAKKLMPCADVVSGMAVLVDAFTPAGSGIVINTPIYPPFRVSGAVGERHLVEARMTAEGRLDLEILEAAFAREDVSGYLLCNPHNPFGTVHTPEELEAVARLARAHDVVVISDEIHGPLVAPGVRFTSYLAVPGSENGFVVTSASKAFNLAALKAGLLIAGSEQVEALWKLPYEVRAGSSHLGLLLQAAGLDSDREWLAELNAEIVANKALLASLLPQVGLEYTPSEGTYLAWVDASPLGFEHPAMTLRARGRVAFNPGTDYAGDHGQWIRINLATSPAIIREAVRRIGVARG